jgi:hypothetical protein
MPKFQINSGLPSLPSGLKDDAYNLVAPLYRALSGVAQQLSLQTGAVQFAPGEMAQVDPFSLLQSNRLSRIFVQATEALSYGQLLNIYDSGGTLSARKADALDLSKPAHAICDQVGGIANGQSGEALFMSGRTLGIGGTTVGAAYYLSTDGAIQLTPPVATGVINQIVGVGLGSGGFYLNIEPVGRRPVLVYEFSATIIRVLYNDGTFTDIPK